MNRVRRVVQIVAVLVFLGGTERFWVEYDPLVAIAGLASREFDWPLVARAMILAGATLVVGRFFCGWLCPLGGILDFVHHFGLRPQGRGLDELRPRSRWKYLVLAAVLFAAVCGTTIFLLADPLVLLARTRELVLVPAANWAAYGAVRAVRLLPGKESVTLTAWADPPVYSFLTITVVVFSTILLLERIERRFWCRNLCPLGGLLSLLSRTALVRRFVQGACSSCARCERDCPTGAIPVEDFTQTRKGECIQCLRCQRVCAGDNVRFGIRGRHTAPAFDPTRRQALIAAGVGTAAGLLGGVSTRAATRPGSHIRPPGAVPEGEFLSRCIRCLVCVDACPTRALRPCGAEAGWEGLWTPKLVPTSGGCEEPCHACTQVCPTLAIRRLSHEEKSFAKIGTARVIKERCVAWEEVKACLVCDEVCPYDAIEFMVISDHRGTQNRPVVHAEKCLGCGLCENACPVREPRAIVVEHYGEERLSTGSYITPAKREARQVQDDRETDYLREYRLDNRTQPDTSHRADSTPTKETAPGAAEEPLPPGFVVD